MHDDVKGMMRKATPEACQSLILHTYQEYVVARTHWGGWSGGIYWVASWTSYTALGLGPGMGGGKLRPRERFHFIARLRL